MPEGYDAPKGPSLAEKIGRELTAKWLAYDLAPHAGLKGEIRGLAHALALIRLAPSKPTDKDIKDIAEEHRL